MTTRDPTTTKRKILDAGVRLIRRQGFASATIDQVCAAAGITKGAFFHHFGNKEELAVACAAHFAAFADEVFANAPYRKAGDPIDRVFGYVDFRMQIIGGALEDFTCLLGTLAQETYNMVPKVRDAAGEHLEAHVKMLSEDLELARRLYAPHATWTAESLARFMQASIQGAFILAKARNDPETARDCLVHLRRYLESQFDRSERSNERRKKT